MKKILIAILSLNLSYDAFCSSASEDRSYHGEKDLSEYNKSFDLYAYLPSWKTALLTVAVIGTGGLFYFQWQRARRLGAQAPQLLKAPTPQNSYLQTVAKILKSSADVVTKRRQLIETARTIQRHSQEEIIRAGKKAKIDFYKILTRTFHIVNIEQFNAVNEHKRQREMLLHLVEKYGS